MIMMLHAGGGRESRGEREEEVCESLCRREILVGGRPKQKERQKHFALNHTRNRFFPMKTFLVSQKSHLMR